MAIMARLDWEMLHPSMTLDQLGFIPTFLSKDDPRSAREQFDANYRYGGGWHPLKGWRLNQKILSLEYDGDPPIRALAKCYLREELIVYYEHSWVAIIQKDGSCEVSRMD